MIYKILNECIGFVPIQCSNPVDYKTAEQLENMHDAKIKQEIIPRENLYTNLSKLLRYLRISLSS